MNNKIILLYRRNSIWYCDDLQILHLQDLPTRFDSFNNQQVVEKVDYMLNIENW